ncbi:MAG: c-type cytochrome [Dongiaceae bacterium]
MTRRRTLALSLAMAAVAIGIGAGAIWWLAGRSTRIDPGDAKQVAAGEALYRAHCASCHGANLEGQPDWRTRLPTGRLPAPPHDESGHTWHHPDEVLVRIIEDGPAFYATLRVETDMPAFGQKLSDRDIAAVLAYIKSRWPANVRDRQAHVSR